METSRDAMRTRTHELVGWAQHQTGGRRPWNVRAALSSCSSGSDRGTTKACGKLKGSNINTNNNSTTTSTSVLALKIGSSGGSHLSHNWKRSLAWQTRQCSPARQRSISSCQSPAAANDRTPGTAGVAGSLWKTKKNVKKKGMSRKKNNQIVHPRTGIRR